MSSRLCLKRIFIARLSYCCVDCMRDGLYGCSVVSLWAADVYPRNPMQFSSWVAQCFYIVNVALLVSTVFYYEQAADYYLCACFILKNKYRICLSHLWCIEYCVCEYYAYNCLIHLYMPIFTISILIKFIIFNEVVN